MPMAQRGRTIRSRQIQALLVIAVVAGAYFLISVRAIDHVGRLFADWFMGGSENPVVVAPGAGPIVDGFPLGLPAACALRQCDEWIRLGLSALEDREPEHAEVLNVRIYREDLTNPLLFEPGVIHARSGTLVVVVFELADGAKRATGVYCGVGPCIGLASYPH